MNGSYHHDEVLIPDPRGNISPRQHVEQRLAKLGVPAQRSSHVELAPLVRIADDEEVMDVLLDDPLIIHTRLAGS